MAGLTGEILTKRIYAAAAADDGYRILVDRLWPRGVSREKAAVDFWARETAPSDALRKWYRHDRQKWPEFKRRYFAELRSNRQAVSQLREHLNHPRVTLLFSSRETELNNASALRAFFTQS